MSRYRLGQICLLLLAFAVRLHNLTYHSLWFDEAISVHWAKQDIPRILEVGFTLVEDRLPPLYYLLLKAWASHVGWSEFGLRSLSVFFGWLLIPVTMRLTMMLGNRRLALLTGWLLAGNPFLIWYSQEVRMYAPAVLFSTVAVWCYLAWVRSSHLSGNYKPTPPSLPSLFPLLCFILFATAGLYCHLYSGFLLPALGLWLLISYPRQWRLWLIFGLSGLLISLAYMPILWAIWQFSGEAQAGDPLTGLADRATWLLRAFTIWKAPLTETWQSVILVVVGLLTAIGLLMPGKDSPKSPKKLPNPVLLMGLLLTMPFLIANLLLLRNYLAFFGERYFIIMVPWLMLLAARGSLHLDDWLRPWLTHLSRRLNLPKSNRQAQGTFQIKMLIFCWPISYLLIGLVWLTIPGQWSLPATKEAWRQTVAYLADRAAPNHGILIHPDWVRYPFQFYFRGPGQTYAAFSDVSPTTDLDGPLQGVINDHPVIWLIQSHQDGPDPDRLVEQWFAQRYPLVTELYPPGITLKGYAPGYQLDSLPTTATPVDISFSNGLQLRGYQAETNVSATDALFHPPSGWLHVTLYWSTQQPLTTNQQPIVQLIGSAGVWGVSLDRPTDALKFYPTSRWPVGQIIRQDVDVNLNSVTPPGSYQLVVSLQDETYPLTTVEIR